MKLAIVGSRSFNNYDLLKGNLAPLMSEITLIVSGGAAGADTLGEKFADEFKIPKLIIKPDWNRYGKRAGFLRNYDIVKNVDKVIAFWDGKSKGTEHTINYAKHELKLLKVIEV